MINEKIIDAIEASIDVKSKLKEQSRIIEKVGTIMSTSINSGGKLLFFGNGGSAADSQHIVAELVGKFKKQRDGLPAISLTTNSSILTAIGNDFGYEYVFQRQVEAIGSKNDVAIGISTSGNSLNVINGILAAKKIGLNTISLTGSSGGKLSELVDIAIKVPSNDTQRIQESHILIGHILCEIIEELL